MLTSLLMLQALHGGPKTRTLNGIRSRQKVRAVTEAYVSVSALGARLPHTQHVHASAYWTTSAWGEEGGFSNLQNQRTPSAGGGGAAAAREGATL